MKKLVVILSGLLFLCACGGGSSNNTPTAPAISVALSPSAQSSIDQGQTVSFTATVSNDSANAGVNWSMSGTGCSGSACGTFTNSSTTAATYNAPATVSSSMTVSVTATSVTDSTKSMSSKVVVAPAPSITTTTLAAGTVGTAYSATLAATGGTGTLTWSLASGSSLPAGLSLASGAISGTPTAEGTSTFTVKVTDAASTPLSATQQLSLTINPIALAITTTTLSGGTVNSTYSATLKSSGGTGTVTWTVASGTLPAGLNLSTGGAISGTPTAASTSNFTVKATDSGTPAQSKTQALSIVINPALAISTTTLAGGVVGTNYSATISASGGTLPVAWSVTSGALPSGLTLAATATASGTISGIPTATGTFNFTATAKDSSSPAASVNQALSITIANAPLKVTTTSLPNAVVNTAYSEPLQASGGTPPYTWTVASGSSLPSWLTISGSGTSWTIAGTPTATGPVSFSLTVTDSSSPTAQSVNQAYSFIIAAAAACSDSGSESLLKGQYAFGLSGYTESGFLAAIGSFTADGTGKITAGVLDSNGTIVQSAASIDTTQSFYAVGSNHLGCATIVTSSGTFTTRLSVGGITSNVATEGRLVEWDSATNYLAAVGQIRKQTVPTSVPSGSYTYGYTGVYGTSQYRTGVAGMITTQAGTSGGTVTAGEYDINVEGVINNGAGLSTPYSGITGTYTAPDPTTGRFTSATTLNSVTANHVAYLISGSQFVEMSTDALTSHTAILVGLAQLQSGSLSLTTGSNLVYYATGTQSAELGIINVTGSSGYTANYYEDVDGSAETPQSPQCSYTLDAHGRVATSGATCTMYLTTYKTMYPPVFYLSGPNTGVMLGTGAGVYAGQVEPQVAPSGGFSSTSISGAFYDGDSEVAGEGTAADDMIDVESLTFNGSGGVDIIGDYIGAAGSVVTQHADQTSNITLGTVNSNGTFTTNTSNYTGINAIMISTTKIVDIDNANQAFPIIQMIKQ
jgi:hypothetical protein